MSRTVPSRSGHTSLPEGQRPVPDQFRRGVVHLQPVGLDEPVAETGQMWTVTSCLTARWTTHAPQIADE